MFKILQKVFINKYSSLLNFNYYNFIIYKSIDSNRYFISDLYTIVKLFS